MRTRRTVRDVRRHNRSILLSTLYLGEHRSRQELSRMTGLSQATVSNVMADLVAEGLVVEAGLAGSDGGRPRVLLRVDPGYARVVGVDVGETRVRAEIVDLGMRPLAAVDHPLPAGRPDPVAVAEQILASVRQLTVTTGPGEVLGIGIGVPGTVEQGRQAVVHAQTIGWDAVPLEGLLRAGTDLPIWIDNGAKTLGQAEMWIGAGRGADTAVVTLVGSGVGAAVITDGDVYRGASSSAGEWGHTTLVYGGRACRCGSLGCLEAYIGAGAVLDRWREARAAAGSGDSARDGVSGHEDGDRAAGAGGAMGGTEGGDGSRGRGSAEESALAALLAAADTDPVAGAVLAETVGYLGAGIADLVNLFNPERIVVAGWVGRLVGERRLDLIREAVERRALRHPFSQTSIVLGQLGPDAVAVGAATLPVADLLARGGMRTRSHPAADTYLTSRPEVADRARAVAASA